MVNYILGWIKNKKAKSNAESFIGDALDIKNISKYIENYVNIKNTKRITLKSQILMSGKLLCFKS